MGKLSLIIQAEPCMISRVISQEGGRRVRVRVRDLKMLALKMEEGTVSPSM